MGQGQPPLSHFTTSRPVAVLMLFLSAVVFGYFSYDRLPVNLMPELNYPTLTIRTEYPGAAPEEVENEISRPIEEAVGVIPGLKQVSSISRAGVSDVVLEFAWGTQMSKASQEALEKLELVVLPKDADRPLLLHFDPQLDPILELSLSGEGDLYAGEQGLRRLRRLAELQVKRVLETLPGVAAVRVRGGLEEEYHVLLDKTALDRTGVSIQLIIDRLRQENINVAGGTLNEGRAEFMVRTLNEFTTLDEIGETIVTRVGGQNIRISDLGRVVQAHKEREMLTRTNGRESVQIDIYKEADANMVAVARAVGQAVGRISAELKESAGKTAKSPQKKRGEGLAQKLFHEAGARLEIVADRSLFVKSSITEVRKTAVYGGLLAIAVLFLFLRDVRTTAIVGVSIPISLLITFAPLNLFGVSLNIMSLGGLALGIGMLVDCSIVVLESIFRCREEGDDLITAAVRGTQNVKGAVCASTLTTVAVFFPMIFVEGLAGQVFADLSWAVVISLIASLLVALYFIPMLASRQKIPVQERTELLQDQPGGLGWERFKADIGQSTGSWKLLSTPYQVLRFTIYLLLGGTGKLLLLLITTVVWLLAASIRTTWFLLERYFLRPLTAGSSLVLSQIQRVYPPLLKVALENSLLVLLLVAVTMVLTWRVALSVHSELLPDVHQGEFTFELSLPVGTPLERTIEVLSHVERSILLNKDQIASLIVTFGFDALNMRRSDEGEHTARFRVILEENHRDPRSELEIISNLRQAFSQLPDLTVRLTRPVLFSSKHPIVIEIQGDDLDKLKLLSREVEEVLSEVPTLADVEGLLRSGAPEVQVVYHREKLAHYGLNLSSVAKQVRDLVKGYEATRFNMRDRRIPIVARLDEPARSHVEHLRELVINPGGEQPIPLSAIARLQIGEGPSEIRRIDGRRVAVLQADVAAGSLGAAVQTIEKTLAGKINWPPGITYYIAGQTEEWERSRSTLYLALALSLFLVYVIMAAQFESLLQPLIIMFTIPLAFFGSVIGLKLAGVNISIVVFLGLIMLGGIVVNNGIVLVDYANQLRLSGMVLKEAVLQAGMVRLRPILMTTATTVLGLLPMALGFGDGAEIRTPMALTVICGLATSTLLTLVVIPTFYFWLQAWRDRQGALLAPVLNSSREPILAK